jgi:hypothetical protein
MKVNVEQQATFVGMLTEGYALTASNIRGLFGVAFPQKFVDVIAERTGLCIRRGKLLSDELEVELAYFLSEEVQLNGAGLENIELPAEVMPETLDIVEHTNGHYIMWVCPEILSDGHHEELCSQFHKVDLGDEELVRPTAVKCTKCGKENQIKPHAWR